MATAERISQEIQEWVRIAEPSNLLNFYTAWEIFKAKLNESSSSNNEIVLPSGKVSQVKRFTRDGTEHNDDIYFTVVFLVGTEYFKVDGFYDEWNGEPWDLPAVEKLSEISC